MFLRVCKGPIVVMVRAREAHRVVEHVHDGIIRSYINLSLLRIETVCVFVVLRARKLIDVR